MSTLPNTYSDNQYFAANKYKWDVTQTSAGPGVGQHGHLRQHRSQRETDQRGQRCT